MSGEWRTEYGPRLIRFTQLDHGLALWIASDKVVTLSAAVAENGTRIKVVSGDSIIVAEALDTVLEALRWK